MKRLLALSTIVVAIGVSAVPAGALTQSNTKTYNFSNQVTVKDTGGISQIGVCPPHVPCSVQHTLSTPSASATNVNTVTIVQTNTNP